MSIYVFSLLVQYVQSGIDNAQGIRHKFLQKTGIPINYIFMDLPRERELLMYESVGIPCESMLSMHLFLADNDGLARRVDVTVKIEELKRKHGITDIVRNGQHIDLYRGVNRVASILLAEDERYVLEINYYDKERLIVCEVYGSRLLYVHHYNTVIEGGYAYAKKVRTTFVSKTGECVYECLYDVDGEMRYVFPDGRFYTAQQLEEEFIKKLCLSEKDIIILDRPSYFDYIQPLFKYSNGAKKVGFFHSGHYYKKGENHYALYLNREYYYWFKYAKYMDWMLVSTEEQRLDLVDKLKKYQCDMPNTKVIPVGALEKLRYSSARKKNSLLTVSRIDRRKRADLVVESVIKAHQKNEDITLDIYGNGEEEEINNLMRLIEENQAQEYICYKGFCDVRDVYAQYEGYISSSLGETFGLSLMEAAGSGNALIGLDVRYGNSLFIQDGMNGRKIAFNVEDIEDPLRVQEMIEKMGEAIVDLFKDEEILRKYQEHSYQIAEQFLVDKIEMQWIDFIKTILHS